MNLEILLSKMSVIIVTHVFAMGQAQELKKFLLNRVRRLAFIGHPFSFSREKRSFIEAYENGKLVLNLGAPPIGGPQILLFLKDILFTLYFTFKVRKKFDVYYGANCLNAFLGILLKKLGVVKIVIFNTVDYVPNRFQNRILNGFYQWLDRLSCYFSDTVWNLSHAMAKARWSRGFSKEKSAPQLTVPIGCNFHRIERLPLEKINRFSIVYAGYLGKFKGIELLIDSMPRIVKEVPEAKLVIVGGGPLEGFLKEKVKALQLTNYVEFKGYFMDHSDVEKILAKCALGVALYEPVPDNYTWFADPAKPKQYMACGLPVIITKVPSIAYEIEKRKSGIVVDYEKSELVNALIELLKNDELYKELRENAIRFASEFDWNHIFENAFYKLLNSNTLHAFNNLRKVRYIKFQRSIYAKEFATYKKYELENWRISYLNRIFGALNLQRNDVFLDIGVGGSGYTVIECCKMGVRSIGVDLSSEGMKTANRFAKEILGSKFSLCDFITCSAHYLPFRNSSISKIASIAVLEHVPDDEKVISEISRIAINDARIFITVPNTYTRILPLFIIPYKIHDKRVGHLRHYKAEELAAKFASKGLALNAIFYHAQIVKVLQQLLSMVFPSLERENSKVWWSLEKIDYKIHKIPTGMHLSILFKKVDR